jgi:hypothetical protein
VSGNVQERQRLDSKRIINTSTVFSTVRQNFAAKQRNCAQRAADMGLPNYLAVRNGMRHCENERKKPFFNYGSERWQPQAVRTLLHVGRPFISDETHAVFRRQQRQNQTPEIEFD